MKQASNVIFVISSTLMIGEFLCSLYESYACIVSVIIPLNCILIILYHVGEIFFDFVLAFAEKAKRKDLFDNAFGTKLAVKNSEGYYTNTGLPPGVYKLGVNNYESCFFTYRILKNDLWQNVTRVIIGSVLFGSCRPHIPWCPQNRAAHIHRLRCRGSLATHSGCVQNLRLSGSRCSDIISCSTSSVANHGTIDHKGKNENMLMLEFHDE